MEDKNKKKEFPQDPNFRKILFIRNILVVMALVMVGLNFYTSKQKSLEITATEFKELMLKGEVTSIEYASPKIIGFRDAKNKKLPSVYMVPVTNEEMEEIRLKAIELNISYKGRVISVVMIVILKEVFFLALWIGFFYWIMKKQQKDIRGFSQTRAKQFQKDKSNVTFADVAGCDEAKEELEEIVDFIRRPERFIKVGAVIPKGVLLSGPPGTGKTLLAKATAGEANAGFISCSGSEFVEMFVGVGAGRVRDLFEKAKKIKPCIIFIDEIDAVGQKRATGFGGGHDEREQTLNQILKEMDGFDSGKGIIVIAATNRADRLDSALTRSGRFDRKIIVTPPDRAGREAILKIHTKGKKLDEDVNLADVAKDTATMVGADLANIVNEAALFAGRRNSEKISQKDFSDAVDKVSMGAERKSVQFTEKELRNTAYHESGHTLVAMLTPDADKIHKVTIVPRGEALGFAKPISEDRYSLIRNQLEAMIKVCLGGRVAEEIIFGDYTTGASSDFQKATTILKKMIYEWGMYKDIGMVVYDSSSGMFGQPLGIDASEETKKTLEKFLKEKLDNLYQEVVELLTKNKPKLEALAKALLEKETLNSEDINNIIESA